MTEADGVLLSNGQSSIFLHPPIQYPNGHGYHHLVELAGGPFRGAIDATSYEHLRSLRRFYDELNALYRDLTGEARLAGGYENLKVSLKGDGRGHIEVRVEAMAGPCMEIRLKYDFSMDQTQLPEAIDALKRLLLPA
jgi:hypothetical protein